MVDVARNTDIRTPEQRQKIVNEAAKIIGYTVIQRDKVDAELCRYDEQLAARNHYTARRSKQTVKDVRRFYDLLRKLRSLANRLPEDFRLFLDPMIRNFQVYEAVLGKKVVHTGKFQIDVRPGDRKRDADGKRLAAEAALRVCQLHSIEPMTTKGGEWCRLAALFYGDKRADLQHHCRAIKRRIALSAKTG